MDSLINISEGASLGMHSLAYMAAKKPEKLNTKSLADKLDASKAHLSKVLQKLHKAGLVESYRGPTGGYTLSKSPKTVTLLDIYEVIEGKVEVEECPLGKEECMFENCIFNDTLHGVENEIYETLKNINLSNFAKEIQL